VPGTIPGVLGVVAFGGIKFVGYSLAVSGLKKVEPTITASATKIAVVRTGLGILLGPLASILFVYLLGFIVSRFAPSSPLLHSGSPMPVLYGILFFVRIFVWAFVLFLFTKNARFRYPGFGFIRFSVQRFPACSTGPDTPWQSQPQGKSFSVSSNRDLSTE
jgi:hypothetical protein